MGKNTESLVAQISQIARRLLTNLCVSVPVCMSLCLSVCSFLGRDMGKVALLSELKKIIKKEKAAEKKIVFTNGCFDLIHIGHIRYLREAKRRGDLLIVAVNSDQSVRKLKGEERPLVPEGERAEIVSALASLDYVVIFPEETPAEIIEVLEPDILVKGEDYQKEDIVGRETVEASGGEVVTIPLSEGHSTKGLLKKIRQQAIA